jgi:hypothetical protein
MGDEVPVIERSDATALVHQNVNDHSDDERSVQLQKKRTSRGLESFVVPNSDNPQNESSVDGNSDSANRASDSSFVKDMEINQKTPPRSQSGPLGSHISFQDAPYLPSTQYANKQSVAIPLTASSNSQHRDLKEEEIFL